MIEKSDVTIIGGGPAGLAAAVAAKKRIPSSRVVIIERDSCPGGILRQCIHNGFGLHHFGEELTGPEYAARFVEEARAVGVEIWTDAMVLSVTPEKVVTCVSRERGVCRVESGAVVLAMGCRERTRGALGIPGTRPAGVYTAGCAQRLVNMDGFMPGREVVILGSGDIGLIMARRMTWEGARVKLVAEIMPYSSGLNRNIVQCLKDNDIPLKFNHTVTCIHGRKRVEGVTISEVDPATRKPIPGTEFRIDCDTLLLSVGLIPENELTSACGIELDRVTSGAKVDDSRQTSIPGIFACGNVLHVHDLVDNVSAESMLAGTAAADYAAAVQNVASDVRPADAQERVPPAKVPQDALKCKVPAKVLADAQERVSHAEVPQCADACGSALACVNVVPSGAVRYTVPQRIRKAGQGKVDVYFRVGRVCRPAKLVAKCGSEIVATRSKPVMTPGEMEKVTIDADALSGDIEISVE